MARKSTPKQAHPVDVILENIDLQKAGQVVLPLPLATAVPAGKVDPVSAVRKAKVNAKVKKNLDDEAQQNEAEVSDLAITDADQEWSKEFEQPVLLAQAAPAKETDSSPSSVGEALLRQATPLPEKITPSTPTDLVAETASKFPSWGLPLALGAGALALAGGGGGGSKVGGNIESGADGSEGAGAEIPTTYSLTILPMAGKFDQGGIQIEIFKNGSSQPWRVLSTDDPDVQFNNTDGRFTLKVLRSELAPGDVLQLVLKDANGTASNYRDETSGKVADLGKDTVFNAWVSVPGELTTSGALSLAVTPLTELAHRNLAPVSGSVPIAADILASNNSVAKAFGLQVPGGINVDLVLTAPVSTYDHAAFRESDAASQVYGQALGLISSLALNLKSAIEAGTAPTPRSLIEALNLLMDHGAGQNPTDFTLSPQALAELSKAAVDYNKAASGTLAVTLPGVNLNEPLGLDGAVSLYDYDQGGLAFKIYAPYGSKAGDKVLLKFQAYKLDGTLSDEVFIFEHTLKSPLAPNDRNYQGEEVSLPRLVANPTYALELRPVTDASGKSLKDIGGLTPEQQLAKYRVSIDGITGVSVQQDFELNFSPISIQNLARPNSTKVNASEKVQVRVVLDQDALWNTAPGDERPSLTIQYVGRDGLRHDAVSTLTDEGRGHVLTFTFEFTSGVPANGYISLAAGALKGDLWDAVGEKISTGSVNTSFTKELLFVDTVLPPSATVSLASPDEAQLNVDIGGGATATFINKLTPELLIKFQDADGTNPSDALPAYESQPVTVQLFAYEANSSSRPTSGATLIATVVVKPGDPFAKFTAESYNADWKTKALDADGQAYRFYAKVVDAAENVSQLLPDESDLPLWVDTQKPLPAEMTFDAEGAVNAAGDPLPGDKQTNDTTPGFKVTGEAGSTVKLYEVSLNPDGSLVVGSEVANGVLSGDLGQTGPGSTTISPTAPLADGEHHFVTVLTDKAGNKSPLSAVETVRIKTTVSSAVTLSIVDAPASGYYTADQKITIQAKFAEAVYFDPDLDPRPVPYITFKNKDGGSDRTATFVSGAGSDTLTFSYTVPGDGSADSGQGQFIQFTGGNVNFYNASSLVDVVGNALNPALTLTLTPPPATGLVIDTTAPTAPGVTLAGGVVGAVSKDEALAGLVKVVAEEGSSVTVTFTSNGKSITKPISSAASGGHTVALTQTDLENLGVANVNDARLSVSARATDKAGNVSAVGSLSSPLTLDTLAPVVSSAARLDGTPTVIAHQGSGSVREFSFTVTFNEPLDSTTVPSANNFALVNSSGGSVGEIRGVTSMGGNRYTVTVRPSTDIEGTVVLKLVADAASDNPLKDAAGNTISNAVLNTGGALMAQQLVDTVRPMVSAVTHNVEAPPTNGPVVFTVTFSEAVKAVGSVSESFSALNGVVKSVEAVTGTNNQFRVSVDPLPNTPSGNLALSIKPSLIGGFVDLNGNSLFATGAGEVSLSAKGGAVLVDNVKPLAPVLAPVNAVNDILSLAKTKAAFTVTAEASSHVELTFTNGLNMVNKTVGGTGAAVTVTLSDDEITRLGLLNTDSASLSLSAVSTDQARNTSEASTPLSVNVDTKAPTVSSVTDSVQGTAGPADISFTVNFSEALAQGPTAANFALKDSLGTVQSVTPVEGNSRAYTAVVRPAADKSGTLALVLTGALADAAGNTLPASVDLGTLNSQPFDAVAPVVLSVVDDISAEYANAESTVVYTVRFSKALASSLTSDQLKAAFTDDNGEVLSVSAVTGSNNPVFNVRVKPTLGKEGDLMGLNVLTDRLQDALGNKVLAWEQTEGLQKIDTKAPSAPGIALNADSNTGSKDDNITSVTRPSFDLTGLEDGATVTIFNGSQSIFSGLVQSATMKVTLANELLEGSYTNIRVSQTDARGNVGVSSSLSELLIQSRPTGVLSNLVFDATQDRTRNDGVVLDVIARDYTTGNPTPSFNFTGGTVGSQAVLFLDKDKDGVLDEGEELGRTTISDSAPRVVSVNPLNALTKGTYGSASSLGEISVLEINASGLQGVSSKLQLLNVPNGDGSISIFTGLTVNPATPKVITIESTEASGTTNAGVLKFNVTGGQQYRTITVIADATVGSTETKDVVLGTVASPNGTGSISLDVSKLATTGSVLYKNFQAYQSYVNTNSDKVSVSFTGGSTASTDGITLDHAAPTVSSVVTDKTSLYKGETSALTITFSEAVTGLATSDFSISGGGSVSNLLSTEGGKVWTATYTPEANSTASASISVKTGSTTLKDLANNSLGSTVTPITLAINTMEQVAPTIAVPDATLDSDLVVGTAYAINGGNPVTVDDANNNLAKVVLSVSQGTLSIAATDGVTIQGDGTTATPLTLTATGTGTAAKDALNAALAQLMFTAATLDVATLNIVSHDTAVGSAAALSSTASLTLSNIASPPVAPVNALPAAGVDQATTAIVAGRAFAFTAGNLLKVSDVNDDIASVRLSVNHGVLVIDTTDGVTITGSGGSTVTLAPVGASDAATTAALNAALAKLTYTANGSAAVSDTLSMVSTDVHGRSDDDSLALDVKAAPIAPVNAVPSNGPEGIITGTAKAISGITVADGDNNIASVKLSVGKGTLSIAEVPTGVIVSGTGTADDPLTLTLGAGITGAAATTALNTALAKLAYTATAGYVGEDSLTVLTTDSTGTALNSSGALTVSDAMTLTVNAAPLAPVNFLPAAPGGIITGQAFNFSGITVDDGDGNLASVTLSVGHGTLTVSAEADSGVTVSTNDPGSVKLTGTDAAKLNTVLGSLTYTATSAYTGADKLIVTTEDSTSAALGGVRRDRSELDFTVYAAPIAPVNSLPNTPPTVLMGQAKVINGITVSDGDNNIVSVQLTVTNGVLSVTAMDGVTVDSNGTASVTLTGSSTPALNAVLASLSYTAGLDYFGVETLTVLTTDSTPANLGNAKFVSNELNFDVLAAPVNTLTAPSSAVGGTSLTLSGLSVADADSNLSKVVLSVTDGALSSTTTDGVEQSADGKSLTFTGDLAAIKSALSTLSYTLADQRGKNDVTLSMVSTDANGLSDTDAVTFDVAQAEDHDPLGEVVVGNSTGNFVIGAVLSANATLADENGLGALSYQWFRTATGSSEPSLIDGATGDSYTLVGADVGATLSVKVSYTDGAGHAESVSSAATESVTWPDSLAFGVGSTLLNFKHDAPGNSDDVDVGTSSESSKFIALQKGSFYVLDVDGNGTITEADKTTYLTGMTDGSKVSTASGVTLQLLSADQWTALRAELDNTLPAGWSSTADAATASYWTRDLGTPDGTHKVHAFASGDVTSLLDDASQLSPVDAYRYNVFQVI